MANVIIKSDEQKRDEVYILKTFGIRNNAFGRDAAETIARRSREDIEKIRRMEEKRHG